MKGTCPKDSALIRLFMNEAGPRETEQLLHHLAACSRCSLRFDVLRQLKRDLRPKVDGFAGEFGAAEAVPLLRRTAHQKILDIRPKSSPLPARSGPFGILLGFRFAVGFLAILAVVAAGAYLAIARADKRSDLRSPSLKLALLEPSGRISSGPTAFRWTPVLHAEDYVFELIDDSLGCVHIGSTFLITELVLPAEVRSKLVKGRTYVWSVSAHDADSNLLTSRSGSFVIE